MSTPLSRLLTQLSSLKLEETFSCSVFEGSMVAEGGLGELLHCSMGDGRFEWQWL